MYDLPKYSKFHMHMQYMMVDNGRNGDTVSIENLFSVR